MRAATLTRWAAIACAVAVLDLGLTFESLWPTLWIRPQWILSIELAVLVLALALAAERFGRPSPRALAWLSGGFVVLVLTRYAEVTARELYGRAINLYYDAPHVPRVVAMFADGAPAWLLVAAGAAALLALFALYRLTRWSWERLADALAETWPRRLTAAVALAVCAAHLFAPGWFTPPVTANYARQAALLAHALGGGASPLGTSPRFASDFARVAGADVFVIFLESYGAATYDRPEHAARLAAGRAALAAAVEAGGRGVVSAFVESPTFGGASWLAHASLFTGVEVRQSDAYNLLVTERRETLVHAFARHGYRTVALMPGLRQDWREGAAFYGFDAVYDAARLDYRGPDFGWWRIPDQYSLAKLDQLERAGGSRRPLFVFFPTINSHAPFRPTPPYQADWKRLLSDRPYVAGVGHAQRPEWTNLAPAYAEAVDYAFAWLAGYLRERRGADFVLVVLGDHQPPAGVAGENASWEVPVHVIASRKALLGALAASGFAPGLEARRPAIGRIHELTAILAQAFGSGLPPGVDIAGAAVDGEQRTQPGAHPIGL